MAYRLDYDNGSRKFTVYTERFRGDALRRVCLDERAMSMKFYVSFGRAPNHSRVLEPRRVGFYATLVHGQEVDKHTKSVYSGDLAQKLATVGRASSRVLASFCSQLVVPEVKVVVDGLMARGYDEVVNAVGP